MTTWSELAVESLTLIDDERLGDQLRDCPAEFFQRMAHFIRLAVPMLDTPSELQDYIQRDMAEPEFSAASWESTEASLTQRTDVATEAVGFDLCSCLLEETLGDGTVLKTPRAVDYDPETGVVTFPQQERAGLVYDLVFYKDGVFPTLTLAQKNLFIHAIDLLWDERFTSAWLPRTPKQLDSSFQTEKGSTWTEKQSNAHRQKRQDFYTLLKKYGQDCHYTGIPKRRGGRVKLV